MKKIFCLVAVAVLLLTLSVSVFADTELKGNARYDYTISEDGKTAKVVVTLSDYYTANSMMIIPEYDGDQLEMVYGDWLLRGAMTVHWSEDMGDAAIAFSNPTDVNKEVFEMFFEIKGDAKAVENVGAEIIVKSVENQPVGDVGTTAPDTTRYEPVEVLDPTTEPTTEPVVPETPSKETEPPVTAPPTTEPMETVANVTVEPVEPETDAPEETKAEETDSEVTEPVADESELPETEPDTDDGDADKNPTVNYPGGYMTESEYENRYSSDRDGQTAVIVGVVVAVVIAATVAGIIIVKKKSK